MLLPLILFTIGATLTLSSKNNVVSRNDWHLLSSNCNFEAFANQLTMERLAACMDSIMNIKPKSCVRLEKAQNLRNLMH